MDEPALDLFVLVRPGRAALARATIESVRQWIDPPSHRIVIVGQAGEADFLDGRAVLGFSAGDIPVLKTLPAEQRENCFTQMLKWGLAQATQSPAYMAVDAGDVFEGPFPESRRDHMFNFLDYRMHNWLFGMYPPPGGQFAAESMVFDKGVVAEMIALIQKRYGKIRWHDAVLNILNQVSHTRFCAVQSYGGYLESHHRDRARCQTATQIARQAVPADQTPVLRMSTLGVNGRFGNQVFQYGFLRLFAGEHGMEAQNPPWIGSSLFGHKERFSTDPLPLWLEKNGELPAEMAVCGHCPPSHELWGYFQLHTRFFRARQSAFRALFRPLPSIAALLEQAVNRIRGTGMTLVALHLRRGDFGAADFWPAPSHWYVQWLRQIWPTLDRPVLFLASDEPAKIAGDFAEFSPKTAADLGVKLTGAEFYADFFTLTQCDLLAISNSTFSYAAAMLNERAQATMRPDPDQQTLVDFDPWDSPVLLKRRQAA